MKYSVVGNVLCVALVCGFAGVARAVPRPNLIPLPQQVSVLPKPVPLPAKSVIVCVETNVPALRVGIERIQSAIRELGGTPPEVAAAAEPGVFQIRLGTAAVPLVAAAAARDSIRIAANEPGPQGYAIQFQADGQEPGVLLAGSDAQGALYACVTFCQMVKRAGTGILIEAADVRDWPDFRHRLVGRLPAPNRALQQAAGTAGPEYARYAELARRELDFCLDWKINLASIRSGGARALSHVERMGPAARAALREASDYARDRGVLIEAVACSAVDVGQGGPVAEIPDLVEVVDVRYCWSRDAWIRERGRALGQFARDAGIGLYYLHSPDLTSPPDYAGFKRRCALCRARWADGDRAKADAHVMNILYEEIRTLSPSTAVCAVLVPYGASVARMDEPRRKPILDYWREASALLPEDMFVCVRENRRENVAAFKEAWKRQPVYFYIESISWRGWKPLFSTTTRFIRTFDFDDPRDLYLLGNGADFEELVHASAAHYAWNTHAPGSGEQRAYNHDPLHDGTEPAEVARDLADAILSRMFGDLAGPLIGEAIRADISWSFTEKPEELSQAAQDRLAGRESDIPGWEATTLEGLDNIAGLMRHQAERAAVGLQALNRVTKLPAPFAVRFSEPQAAQFNWLLGYFASVRALAAVRAPRFECLAALRAGEYDRAELLAAQGLEEIPRSHRLIDHIAAQVGGTNNWFAPGRRVGQYVDAEKPVLERLVRLADGVVVEEADTAENLGDAAFLLRRGDVTLRQAGNGAVEFGARGARTPEHPALLFTKPERPWGGCEVRFPPIDLRPFLARDGYLRFYVNSAGPKGWQQATFWCLLRADRDAGPAAETSGPWVYLHKPTSEQRKRHEEPGFVTIDDLPDTWQLVSIPLSQLARDGHPFLAGLHLNFAAVPDHGLFLADPYLIGKTDPVSVERRIRP